MFKPLLFVLLLSFSLNAGAYAPMSLSSRSVSVDPMNIYSIVATPEKNDTKYILKVYAEHLRVFLNQENYALEIAI